MPSRENIKAAVIFPDVDGVRLSLSPENRLQEAVGLAVAVGLDVVYQDIVRLKTIKPATFVGQGVMDRIAELVSEASIGLLILDTTLSPIQQRNLEKRLKIKVIDRTALILEIFGERAQTKEGKLQVELAHLTYQRSRLVRSWTHLERQRGGAGFLGGPGETQIELDRRIIDDKIIRIKQDLEKVKKTRLLHRNARKRVPYPIVALVGYTNAGKSTLFNKLSDSNVFAKDLLFATLDPTMRKIVLPSGREVILSDTVGFISDLPHELIMAFRATLEEVLAADLIIHVRDIAAENTKEQCGDVLKVLENLGFEDIENSGKYIEVLNKVDLLPDDKKADMAKKIKNNQIMISAITGEGLPDLENMIDRKSASGFITTTIKVPVSDGRMIAWLYNNAEVLEKRLKGEILVIKIAAEPSVMAKIEAKFSKDK